MQFIIYSDGYKYQLAKTYQVVIPLCPRVGIITEYIDLDTEGLLTIYEGYAWDGPSGPTPDIPSFMRGSLVHDALYQLMRKRLLNHNLHRQAADEILRDICIEDGMWSVVAWFVYYAVNKFGDPSANPASAKPFIYAPRVGLSEIPPTVTIKRTSKEAAKVREANTILMLWRYGARTADEVVVELYRLLKGS